MSVAVAVFAIVAIGALLRAVFQTFSEYGLRSRAQRAEIEMALPVA